MSLKRNMRLVVVIAVLVISMLASGLYGTSAAQTLHHDPAPIPCTYEIGVNSTSPQVYSGYDCSNQQLAYGGPNNVGGANGLSFSSVFNHVGAAIYNHAGGQLILLAGTFNVDGTLLLYYQESVLGMGKQATIIKEANGANLNFMLNFTGATNARSTIEHVMFNGNKANNPSASSCLNLSGESGELIFDVYITQCNKYGVFSDGTGNTWALDHVQIDNSGSSAIYSSAAATRITNNYINNNGGDGLTILNGENFFQDNVVDSNSGNGYNLTTVQRVEIEGGWIGASSFNGILADGLQQSIISGIIFQGNGAAGGTSYYGIALTSKTEQTVENIISNNYIMQTASSGQPISISDTGGTSSSRNIITSNRFLLTNAQINLVIAGYPAGYAGNNEVRDNTPFNPIGKPSGQQYGFQGAGVSWVFGNGQAGSSILAVCTLKAVSAGSISVTIGLGSTTALANADSTVTILITSASANDQTVTSLVVPPNWILSIHNVGANTNTECSTIAIDA